jgi:hypothetical protein
MKLLTLTSVLTITLLVGCGSDSDDDAPPNPLATVSGFCQAWAELACNPNVVNYCAADDADACQSSQSEFCEELVPSNGYDATNASDCLRAVENAYADGDLDADELMVVRALGGECSTLIRGDADEGEACDENSDCDTTAGFTCVQRAGDQGTCQVPREVDAGRSCSAADAVCDDGFYCDGRNCVERLPEDTECLDSSECAEDLRCEVTSNGEAGASGVPSGQGTCVPRAGTLDPCESHDDCVSGFCLALDGGAGECINQIRLARSEPICEQLR